MTSGPRDSRSCCCLATSTHPCPAPTLDPNMPPLTLEGENLGQRHHNLNKLTNNTVKQKTPFHIVKCLPEASDVDRLYKIDVATKYRNVDYIIDNLKSDDMLYVSRALKKCLWLVQDPQYSNIINPEYLEKELFPVMTSKAIAKTLLFIRLHLKDEAKAEIFYKYFESQDKKTEALNKWLPICSVKFIEETVAKERDNITSVSLFKRLCERSFEVFKIFTKKRSVHRYYGFREYVKAASFLLNTNTEEYLKIYEENLDDYDRPSFGPKATELILKKIPTRIFDQLDIYIRKAHLATVGQHLGVDETKDLILKMAKNKKLEGWFSYNNLKTLVQKMPKEGKFEFVKSVFVDKNALVDDGDEVMLCDYAEVQTETLMSCRAGMMKCSAMPGKSVNMSSVYQWYRMAPFVIAFAELKKLIRTESSPDERIAMFKVLITSAGKNTENLHTLLEYFHEKHINEPNKFKISFIGTLISNTDTHKFENKTWNILNELFHNLEVYVDNDNYDIQDATGCIVAYNVLHDIPVPEVIVKKFVSRFSTIKSIQKKLDAAAKEKVFKFLSDQLKKNIEKKSLGNKDDFYDVFHGLEKFMDLLIDWKKNLVDYPALIKLIKDVIKAKAQLSLDANLESIYNKNKSWRRTLFEESLQLVQKEDVFINALKHNPRMILQKREIIDKIIKTNKFYLTKLLSKTRIYFYNSLAVDWIKLYEEKLSTCRTEQDGYQAITLGICILMDRDRFSKLMELYVPENFKVKWSEEDVALLNLRKYFAQQMFLVRPTVNVETVLQFAKGDYLQYALPSLNSVCHKKSKEECKKFLPSLLNGPVSLQKHGIRLAFTKMDSDELTDTFMNIWKVTKNASIRAVIFNLTFDRLSNEKNSAKIQDYWKLLRMFMEKLSAEENRTIYATLAKANSVPIDVRAQYCMMSYKILKSMPPKLNCDSLANGMLGDISKSIDSIDEDFVTEILQKHIDESYVKKTILQDGVSVYKYEHDMRNLIVNYMLNVKTADVQNKRYDKIFKTITMRTIDMWNELNKKQFKARDSFIELMKNMSQEIVNIFQDKDSKYVNPLELFKNIQTECQKLPIEQNYIFVTKLKLVIAYCESAASVLLDVKAAGDVKMDTDSIEENNEKKQYATLISKKLAPIFAAECVEFLKEDLNKYFPSIRSLFKNALVEFVNENYNETHLFSGILLKYFVEDPENVPVNLMAIDMLPQYLYCDEDIKPIFIEVRKKIAANEILEVKIYYHGKVRVGEYE